MAATAENPNILRKMSRLESIFDEEVKNHNMILPRIFLVSIPGVELELVLVKQACVYWARRHPFLRAEIFRNEADQTKYFVKMSDDLAFKFDNVNMYVDTEWERIVDDDLAELFDLSRGPLWTLKVIRILPADRQLDYNYAFVFKTQHSITDGRNAYEVFRQYLNILGALLQHKVCVEMDESVVEDSAFNIEELAYRVVSAEAMASFDPTKSDLDRESRITSAFIEESARPENKFQHFYFDSEKQRLLLAKIKSRARNAKLTSVISTVVCLAFKNLYVKYNVGDIPLNKFQFSLMGSLRDKLGVSNTQMGMYITQYERLLDDRNGGLSLSSVWQLAEEESVDLHRFRSTSRDVDTVVFLDKMFDMIMANPEMSYSDAKFNFKISNIGAMKNTEQENVRIKQCYVRTSNVVNRPGSNLLIGVASVDGNLCFAVSYNEKMIASRVVSELIEQIKQIVDDLIRD
jgi:hypothetical protein